MNDKILSAIRNLSETNRVTSLYAVENGSRVWGFANERSDYDVRMVYVRPLRDYHLVTQKRDQLDAVSDSIDIVGYDLHKFMPLILKSNPTVLEWLVSSTVYLDSFKELNKLRETVSSNFNPRALYLHYIHLAQANYMKYVKPRIIVPAKKYLYVIRGIANSKHVAAAFNLPPISVHSLFDEELIPDYVVSFARLLIATKDDEVHRSEETQRVDAYIEECFDALPDKVVPSCPFSAETLKTLEDILWVNLS